ncbi:hypothetical protein [Actinopolymorpha alba]|uniref:hypothetical protein n=1 Tax=Actinopolymorpha alba TaxID=533267 RepID=UPI0003AB1AB8|nr:hypothetical protein [Actinopolymorpha alba]
MGAFAATAPVIARACMPGGHYVDRANDVVAVEGLLALHDEAVRAGSTLVTGAGFGVLATEAVVAKLCEGRPTPHRVRVDAVASVAVEAGVLGTALAASIVDVLTAGGRRISPTNANRTRPRAAVRERAADDVAPRGGPAATHLPGRGVGEVGRCRVRRARRGACGERSAVRHRHFRSRADRSADTWPAPAARPPAVRSGAATPRRRPARPGPGEGRTPSAQALLGHAVVEWADGTRHEGWLRAGDGMDFTADITATVTELLARGVGRPGSWTPAAALGTDLATTAGSTFILD